MGFSCKRCGFCCKNGIVILYPEDVYKISAYLGLKQACFVKKYCKEIRLCINDSNSLNIYYLDISDFCVFLSNENLCVINEVKPLQCKLAPESYFNSIETWRNCIQFSSINEKPIWDSELSDEYFVEKLIDGYVFEG